MGEEFDTWIAKVMCHTQQHYLHESLGTEIHFEVSYFNRYVYFYWKIGEVKEVDEISTLITILFRYMNQLFFSPVWNGILMT